ncbi:hypothetical protein HYC85_021376 [Camellia sinensis]|uniref:Uncharacterized protein n=1 Tax=Camellia sinensis TaxID=4442 RepID=A0A7J7GHH8_CAMSI|nr:hypothetical protein HYC85_021376 [Camellia sinensis]
MVAGCLTCWCPCITFGRIAEIVDRGSTCKARIITIYNALILWCSMWSERSTVRIDAVCEWLLMFLRGQYFLDESPCTDCCIHCCCEECALCQEYRELKHHGFDMSIGLSLLSLSLGH